MPKLDLLAPLVAGALIVGMFAVALIYAAQQFAAAIEGVGL